MTARKTRTFSEWLMNCKVSDMNRYAHSYGAILRALQGNLGI
jgi:hypothetical protein